MTFLMGTLFDFNRLLILENIFFPPTTYAQIYFCLTLHAGPIKIFKRSLTGSTTDSFFPHIRDTMGAIWWGTRGTCPPLFHFFRDI